MCVARRAAFVGITPCYVPVERQEIEFRDGVAHVTACEAGMAWCVWFCTDMSAAFPEKQEKWQRAVDSTVETALLRTCMFGVLRCLQLCLTA
jgi:hypothetical protein